MPKTYSKFKASKSKKSFKLLVVLVKLAYNIKIGLKYILKTKVQRKRHLELKDVAIYTLYIKSRKNKDFVSVLFIF